MTNPTEFNLSEKIVEADNKKKDNGFVFEKDVKEFIRLLRREFVDELEAMGDFTIEDLQFSLKDINGKIRTLAGDKLI